MMRFAVLLLVFPIVLACGGREASVSAEAQTAETARPDWAAHPFDDVYGIVHKENGDDGAVAFVKTRAEIEDSCSCDLDEESGGDAEEAVLFALSTMWVDVMDHTFSGDTVSGSAGTEYGERDFAARLKGSGANQYAVVLLAPSEDFKAIGGADLLDANWTGAPNNAAPKTVKANPKATATAPKSAPKSTSSAKYTAPVIVSGQDHIHRITNWEMDGYAQVAKAGDPRSPRLQTWTFTDEAKKPASTLLKQALNKAQLKQHRPAKIEQIEVTTQMTGADVKVAFGTAKRAGQKVRFYANIRVAKGSKDAVVQVYFAPEDVYKKWGGVAVPMSVVGVYETKDFSADALKQAGAIAPAKEAAAFEEHYTAKMMALFQGTVAVNMGTLNNMSSFNMATGACAGMANCTVTPDGTGGYTAEIQ